MNVIKRQAVHLIKTHLPATSKMAERNVSNSDPPKPTTVADDSNSNPPAGQINGDILNNPKKHF
ncbi:unnamed protein product [Fusarium graminearum]|uniref:Chromosome 4, complete genome n=2 Tax=Gibberella zeae TaxID=5518 RepID=A0A098DTN0_GIBZE|nr:unnamed protein product [Fusarium graminearum]CAF3624269.1 unnamed protein product [Fusarium graminearum]CAF3644251.1 unnamed protein product [Fusarium graminearum]CAG1971773.1 unnamed protein product [Fusarium graminearum]CAG1995027.1 unnamed protein product [Fusarium graminearum]